jgi:thymidylate synthase ThyX
VGAGDSPARVSVSAFYRETVDHLFAEYEALSEEIFHHLVSKTPRPDDMKQDAYERTLRARAFDVTRYLLPLATNTSLGEIVNARTLENQVAHLLSHTHSEVRHLAELLKKAASEPAWNVNEDSLRALVEEIRRADPALAERAAQELLKEVRVAPTLVKYANANPYEIETRQALRQAAAGLMKDAPIAASPLVDLLDDDPVELELAATLLYEHCHYPYRQIREALQSAGETCRNEIIELGTRHRGKHDELLRAFSAGQHFRFDILMDIGGFRDMHRHRRCVQILQGFTTAHGYDTPPEIEAAGQRDRYDRTMQKTAAAVTALSKCSAPEAAESSQYAIPLAFRTRALFKMDFAEALYISELRTTPAGHTSYRNVAYAMYEAVAQRHPAVAHLFRVHDVKQPVDLLKR